MIVSLEAAAHEAALEDGVLSGYGQNRNDDLFNKSKKAGLRRGKWTTEEESYANRLIYEFKLGLLPLTDGTTLRTFLSKLLNCDPMRISKKFVGANCIGKQVFRRRQQDLEKLSVEQIERSRKELSELERRFLERVAQTNRTRTAPKEGKMAGYDEEGGLAPWMIQPEDNDQMSVSSSSASSSIHQGSLSGQALVQQRLQQQQLGQFQNGYQNFNSLDYGYNQHPNFPKQIDNGYNQRNDGQMYDNSSVISKDNSLVKVKAGKITSGLYGGGNDGGVNSLIPKDQVYHDNSSKSNNRLNDYNYYDGGSNHSNQHNNNNKLSLLHSINGMKIDDPNNLNRVNSLEMLCSLDMVKFSQNQSLDNMANFVLPSSQVTSSFPWYGNTSSDIVGIDVNNANLHGHHSLMNNNNNNQSFDNDIKESASSVSLSDFAMSLWPSMNNLVTAADQKPDIQSIVVAAVEVPTLPIRDDKTDPVESSNNNNNNIVTIKVEKLDATDPTTNNNTKDADKPNVEGSVAASNVTSSPATTNATSPAIIDSPINRCKPDSAPTSATVTGSMSMPMPNQLRHNSSVENFWMLVNMGDLPQPDNDVLSETLWPSMHQSHSDGDDNSTVKSMHSQNSHGSRKRNLAESDHNHKMNNTNNSSSGNYNNKSTNNNDLSRMQGSSNSSQVSAVSAMTGANEHKMKVKKTLQVAFKNNAQSNYNRTDDNEYTTDYNQYNNNQSSSGSMNEKVINQMPFANDNNSFNAVLNSVKSVTNNNNQDATENNGREAIFSSQLQKLYFPSNSNQKGDNNSSNSVNGSSNNHNNNSIMDTSS